MRLIRWGACSCIVCCCATVAQMANELDDGVPVVIVGTMKESRFGIMEQELEEFCVRWNCELFTIENYPRSPPVALTKEQRLLLTAQPKGGATSSGDEGSPSTPTQEPASPDASGASKMVRRRSASLMQRKKFMSAQQHTEDKSSGPSKRTGGSRLVRNRAAVLSQEEEPEEIVNRVSALCLGSQERWGMRTCVCTPVDLLPWCRMWSSSCRRLWRLQEGGDQPHSPYWWIPSPRTLHRSRCRTWRCPPHNENKMPVVP